jgi:hypothetical protein
MSSIHPTTKQLEIVKLGFQPSIKGPEDWFAGSVRINYLFQSIGHGRAGAAEVFTLTSNKYDPSNSLRYRFSFIDSINHCGFTNQPRHRYISEGYYFTRKHSLQQ